MTVVENAFYTLDQNRGVVSKKLPYKRHIM